MSPVSVSLSLSLSLCVSPVSLPVSLQRLTRPGAGWRLVAAQQRGLHARPAPKPRQSTMELILGSASILGGLTRETNTSV